MDHRPSQTFEIPAGGGTWVAVTGYARSARWISVGQTAAFNYRLTRSDGTAVAAWSEPAGERPRELYVPTDVRLEVNQPGAGVAERCTIQEGVTWPGR